MGISTHVLDTANGRPAAGVRVTLEREDLGGGWSPLSAAWTDDDGRVGGLLERGLESAVYRIRFETGDYFERLDQPAFHPQVEVTFAVGDPGQHYHVPLLVSPFGYTTYRGS